MLQNIHTLIVIMKTLIGSYHEKTNSKLHLIKSSCVRLLDKEDIILIKIINGGSIRVTIFEIGN